MEIHFLLIVQQATPFSVNAYLLKHITHKAMHFCNFLVFWSHINNHRHVTDLGVIHAEPIIGANHSHTLTITLLFVWSLFKIPNTFRQDVALCILFETQTHDEYNRTCSFLYGLCKIHVQVCYNTYMFHLHVFLTSLETQKGWMTHANMYIFCVTFITSTCNYLNKHHCCTLFWQQSWNNLSNLMNMYDSY